MDKWLDSKIPKHRRATEDELTKVKQNESKRPDSGKETDTFGGGVLSGTAQTCRNLAIIFVGGLVLFLVLSSPSVQRFCMVMHGRKHPEQYRNNKRLQERYEKVVGSPHPSKSLFPMISEEDLQEMKRKQRRELVENPISNYPVNLIFIRFVEPKEQRIEILKKLLRQIKETEILEKPTKDNPLTSEDERQEAIINTKILIEEASEPKNEGVVTRTRPLLTRPSSRKNN